MRRTGVRVALVAIMQYVQCRVALHVWCALAVLTLVQTPMKGHELQTASYTECDTLPSPLLSIDITSYGVRLVPTSIHLW